MSKPGFETVDQHTPYYRATLNEAARAGEGIVARMFAMARKSLKNRSTEVRGLEAWERVADSIKLLDGHARALSERFPEVLAAAFAQAPEASQSDAGRDRSAMLSSPHFDQLELMDANQVHTSVALARATQAARILSETALAELDTYLSASLGMPSVQAQLNPMRPEVFVTAFQNLLAQTDLPLSVAMDWLLSSSDTLGHELSALYKTLSQALKDRGVSPVGFGVARALASQPVSSPARGAPKLLASYEETTVLTLERLRKLLLGELDVPVAKSGLEAFASQFAREFESGAASTSTADFEATVPAAFEALKEMRQVDLMMERIGNRAPGAVAVGIASLSGNDAMEAVREQLRQEADGLGQLLSLEVVALMVENIASDVRLLDPIKTCIQQIEPALLRLVLVDPRFFSDKTHAARRLLQEITQRSLAFDSVAAPGFSGFTAPLPQAVATLLVMAIESAQPFEQVLQDLIQAWDLEKQPQHLESAVKALEDAEARNLLAEKIAHEISARPDAEKVPLGVLEFLCNPWSQVVAHAQLADSGNTSDPGQYREIVRALLWSAQPELTRQNVGKLTRLVPTLLSKLREGLELIGYPSVKTSEFFELLMKLHEQAFKVPDKAPEPLTAADTLRTSLFNDVDLWVAPAEAKASGFMEMSEALASSAVSIQPALTATSALSAPEPVVPVVAAPVGPTPQTDLELPLGSWVELMVNGAWIRTQLSWASPHGTLFLFTSTYGSTQSMTRRSRDKLLAAGTLRVLAGQPVVDGALDAVVQTAMRNSLDATP